MLFREFSCNHFFFQFRSVGFFSSQYDFFAWSLGQYLSVLPNVLSPSSLTHRRDDFADVMGVSFGNRAIFGFVKMRFDTALSAFRLMLWQCPFAGGLCYLLVQTFTNGLLPTPLN